MKKKLVIAAGILALVAMNGTAVAADENYSLETGKEETSISLNGSYEVTEIVPVYSVNVSWGTTTLEVEHSVGTWSPTNLQYENETTTSNYNASKVNGEDEQLGYGTFHVENRSNEDVYVSASYVPQNNFDEDLAIDDTILSGKINVARVGEDIEVSPLEFDSIPLSAPIDENIISKKRNQTWGKLVLDNYDKLIEALRKRYDKILEKQPLEVGTITVKISTTQSETES